MILNINVYICNMISINEAADLLGVTAKTLRLWEKEGKIKSIRTGTPSLREVIDVI
jgi:excisionase family DNA binding protein